MKIIELLASQLDRDAMEHEIKAPQHIFMESLDFWQLCLEAKRLLIDTELTKKELKNDTDKPSRYSKMAS